jgi:hypothetical protein
VKEPYSNNALDRMPLKDGDVKDAKKGVWHFADVWGRE